MKRCSKFYLHTKKIKQEKSDEIYVYGSKKSLKKLMRLSLSERKRLFRERLRTIAKLYVNKLNAKVNLRIWKMKKLGSYHPSTNTVVLSLYLSMLPHDLIEYVILHEITHKFERKHNKRFYSLISKVYPNYSEYEARLRKLWPLVIRKALFSNLFDKV